LVLSTLHIRWTPSRPSTASSSLIPAPTTRCRRGLQLISVLKGRGVAADCSRAPTARAWSRGWRSWWPRRGVKELYRRSQAHAPSSRRHRHRARPLRHRSAFDRVV
jgi:hypothetical protein